MEYITSCFILMFNEQRMSSDFENLKAIKSHYLSVTG